MQICEAYHFTPHECRALTMFQMRCLCRGVAATDEASRYKRMTPEVRRKADHFKSRYGSF